MEDSGGSPDLPVAVFPNLDKVVFSRAMFSAYQYGIFLRLQVSMLQMDSKLPLETFEAVLNMAVQGAKYCLSVSHLPGPLSCLSRTDGGVPLDKYTRL
jgi:hypothetical protein